MNTHAVKAADVQRNWYVVDAEGKTLGRLATRVAQVLRGKHKPVFSPHLDVGDFVIIVNADKIRVTGNKLNSKYYYSYSGYMGGLSSVVLSEQLRRHPERVLVHAVQGMLPRNRLRAVLMKKLKVYAGATHPHAAQKPEPLEV